MILAGILGCIAFDGVLLFLFLRDRSFRRKIFDQQRVLEDIAEERHVFEAKSRESLAQLVEAQKKSQNILSQVEKVASEMDQEMQQAKDVLANHLDTLIHKMSTALEEPLSHWAARQRVLETIDKRIEKRHQRLTRLLHRCETLVQAISGQLSYEKAYESLEKRRAHEVRELMAQGYGREAIASELGLSQSEVTFMAQL